VGCICCKPQTERQRDTFLLPCYPNRPPSSEESGARCARQSPIILLPSKRFDLCGTFTTLLRTDLMVCAPGTEGLWSTRSRSHCHMLNPCSASQPFHPLHLPAPSSACIWGKGHPWLLWISGCLLASKAPRFTPRRSEIDLQVESTGSTVTIFHSCGFAPSWLTSHLLIFWPLNSVAVGRGTSTPNTLSWRPSGDVPIQVVLDPKPKRPKRPATLCDLYFEQVVVGDHDIPCLGWKSLEKDNRELEHFPPSSTTYPFE
jgi:hypothetical protein